MTRIPYLDGWRGCAVLAVLLAHFGSAQFINLGRVGVELFFVLSGRLMAEILFVRETPLPGFFARRFSRVYPALFIFCVAMLGVAALRGVGPTVPQFLSAITFTANYASIWVGRSDVIDHIWTLCIEEHMYILLGTIAFLHRMRPIRLIPLFSALAAVGVVVGLVQTMQGLNYYEVYWRTDVRGASLLIGVVTYLTLRDGVPQSLGSAWAPLIAGIAGLLLNINVIPDPVKYSLGTACFAVALMTMPQAPSMVSWAINHPIVLRIGVWSYSIYLWQQPFSHIDGSVAYRPLWLATAILAAIASFYLVEQPARRAINRHIKRDSEEQLASASR